MRHIIVLVTFLFSTLTSYADTVKVGIKPSEPWVMYDKNSTIQERKPIGFSIDLWNKIAQNLGLITVNQKLIQSWL